MSEEVKDKLEPELRFPEFRNSSNWTVRKLEDFLKESRIRGNRGDTAKKLTVKLWGKGVFEKEEVLKGSANTQYYRRKAGQFIYSKLDFLNQAFGIIPDYLDGFESTVDLPCFNVAESIDSTFLLEYVKRGDFYRKFGEIADGGRKAKRIQPEIFLSFSISLPTVEEQKRIGDCFSSIDELITVQSQRLESLKAHKKGLLQHLFPAEGETVPKLRFPEFRDAGEWKEDTLDCLAKFRRGSFPQPYGLPEWYDEDNGAPFIQVFDVSDNLRLKAETKNKISKLGAEKSVFIPKGTLIVTLQGSIGRVAITQYDAYIDRTLLIFESFLRPIEKLFFAYIIQNLFEIKKSKAPGGTIKTITKEALSSFIVKLPSLPEQQKIANSFSSLDELITAQAQKLDILKAHKTGLMQQLFPSPEGI